MSRWRPSAEEERWLEVAALPNVAVPPAALTARTGNWRGVGPLARAALFALGVVAALLLLGVLDFADSSTLLVAGLIATLVAEWLTVVKRLHASGVEEGLCVAGFLLIGAWLSLQFAPGPIFADGSFQVLVLVTAAGAAGLRRLNPFITTSAVIAFVYWAGSTAAAQALDRAIGADMTVLIFGCALAALALILGAREYRRPSHDRMLDWLVATLPLAAYAQHADWGRLDPLHVASGGTTRLMTIVLLLALGAALLRTGLRRRRHAPIWGSLGCIAGLAVELRASVPLAAEAWLMLCGLVALVVGVAVDRYLRRTRNGLTSAPLTQSEGALDLLQIAGTALLAQRAAPEPASAEPGIESGGGRFGGGGATGNY
jgi:hypothetical protein